MVEPRTIRPRLHTVPYRNTLTKKDNGVKIDRPHTGTGSLIERPAN